MNALAWVGENPLAHKAQERSEMREHTVDIIVYICHSLVIIILLLCITYCGCYCNK